MILLKLSNIFARVFQFANAQKGGLVSRGARRAKSLSSPAAWQDASREKRPKGRLWGGSEENSNRDHRGLFEDMVEVASCDWGRNSDYGTRKRMKLTKKQGCPSLNQFKTS